MTLNLQSVAGAMGARWDGPPVNASGWSVDTRTQSVGDVYFALIGPTHDGHDFIPTAIEKGASAVVASRDASVPLPNGRGSDGATPQRSRDRKGAVEAARQFDEAAMPQGHVERPDRNRDREGAVPILIVPDTLRALQQTASWARDQWGATIVAVTGSAGKTTTKDAIAHVLSSEIATGKTIGNLNNHVGVPLSILRLPDDARAAVLEMGMNHAGEIRELTAIARPQIGVVTNVGYAHVEFFANGIDGVADAKRELIEGLPADGLAVLNADDPRVARFGDAHPGRTVTFGFSEDADVRAEAADLRADGASFRVDDVKYETGVTGHHNVLNLLAAIAVGREFGIAAERMRDAIRTFTTGKMRGERIEYNGVVVWNDCYNSNPEAAQSMIDVLRATPATHRIAVLGEMLELGACAEELHRRVGRYAAEHGIDVLIGVRGAARAMVEAAAQAGLRAQYFDDAAGAGDYAKTVARAGDAVLFKGSRGVRVERALERFLA